MNVLTEQFQEIQLLTSSENKKQLCSKTHTSKLTILQSSCIAEQQELSKAPWWSLKQSSYFCPVIHSSQNAWCWWTQSHPVSISSVWKLALLHFPDFVSTPVFSSSHTVWVLPRFPLLSFGHGTRWAASQFALYWLHLHCRSGHTALTITTLLTQLPR